MPSSAQSAQKERVLPPTLRAGDTVGVIAPAGPITAEALTVGLAALERRGYRPIHLPTILERDLYFAGSVQRRVDELHRMFADPEVKGIVCFRGGYGSNYLLPHIDLELIRRNPKFFCGCSDITTLLIYFCDQAGLVVFHGPMLQRDAQPDGVDEESWHAATSSAPSVRDFGEQVQVLVPGHAQGMLYGGCLSLLCASLGTPYEIQTRGTILFIEDVAEPAFRIDRMLMQLKLAGKLEDVRGIILGEMLDCARGAQDYTLQEVVLRVVGDLGVPVVYGLPSGHVTRRNITIPLGVAAQLDAGATVVLRHAAAARSAGAAVPISK
ncbi:MAG: LD-carboxypeptidase [Candidatus Korobacteraceae bacterium]